MKKSKLVMVGNGMAGVRTIEELLKVAPDLYDITVFGAEPHPNYSRPLSVKSSFPFQRCPVSSCNWISTAAGAAPG